MSDFVQEFFTSRQNYPDGNTRIGQLDRLWYDSITNTIRISDGITPGGIIVSGGGTGISGYSGYSGISGFSGSGVNPWIKVTSNYTSSSGDRIIADTSGGAFTIDLPAGPALGSYIQILDVGTNNLTIGRNGSTIEGLPADLVLNNPGGMYEFIYDGTTWQVVDATGGISGYSGYSGVRGQSGYSGAVGPTGFSGFSGFSGKDGAASGSGYSGYSGLSGALSPWTLITGNYTAVNGDRLIADTSGGVFTIYLPAAPITGDYIQITDGWNLALNNCIVNPNGSTVEGYTDDVALDLSHVTYEFIYNGSTWEVTGTTGARGQSGYSGYSGYSGEALSPWTVITSNYNAVNNNRLIANTQGGVFTIYLPATPVTGDYIQITDGWNLSINNCIVDPNGGNVEGYTDNVALDLSHVTYEFIYNGSTWEVTGTTGARGQSGYSGLNAISTVNATVVAGLDSQGQGSIVNDVNVIISTANNPSGVTLPSTAAGKVIVIINRGINAINVYPASGDSIDSYAVNMPIQISVNGWMEFTAVGGGQWYSTGNLVKTGGPRVVYVADGTSITPNANISDVMIQLNSQIGGTLTINAPTGAAVNCQQLGLYIQTANIQSLIFDSIYGGSIDLALPTVTSGGGMYDYMNFMYNSGVSKWQLLIKNFGF